MRKLLSGLLGALVLAGSSCKRAPSVEDVPVGADVQLTRRDGALIEGKLVGRDATAVTIDVGPRTKAVPKDDLAAVAVVPETGPAPALPPEARFREITVPAGTTLAVRLTQPVSSTSSQTGDAVEGELANTVRLSETDVLPSGSRVSGEVTSAVPAGKVKGRASVALAFRQVHAYGDRYPLDAKFSMTAPSTTGDDAKTIGIPAAGGAVVGAIIGGKKGAAIGAAVGGGAGTARVLSTRGDEVVLDEGTVLSVTTTEPIEAKVPITRTGTQAED